MILTPALKMALCKMIAAGIVAQHRAECPPGFDPKMSSAAIIGGVLAVGAAAYSVEQQKSMQKKQLAAQADAANQLNGNPLGHVPEPALYEPVDFDQSQLDAIEGNRNALPFIRQLLSQSNNFVTKDALNRANKLIPNYNASMATLGDSTLDLLSGKLPYDDVLDIVGDRAGVGGGLNIPGVSHGATLKDLGLGRVDALGKGAGLLGQMVSLAEQVSPRSTYGKPSDFFMSPLERIRLEMEQHQLNQQSQQNANNLEAGADPNAVARLQLGLGQSMMPQPAGPDYASAANQIIGAVGGIYGAGTNQGWWGTAKPNAQGGYMTEAASNRANPNAYTSLNVPGRGWQPYTEAEWYGDWSGV